MILIGELARLLGVTSRTLRHYDQIGLFPPAQLHPDNGYRYYRPEQIALLERIVQLRRLDVPLEAIKRCVTEGLLDDAESFARFLHEHREALQGDLASRIRLLDELNRLIATVEKGSPMQGPTLKPVIVELPAFEVIGMSVLCEDPTPIPVLWQNFIVRSHEIVPKAYPQRAYGVGVPESAERFRYYASWGSEPGTPVPEGMERLVIPAQRYARFTHVGPAIAVVETYRQIWESLEPVWQLRHQLGPQFELHDERFKGPQHPLSEVDIHIPIA
ncbi:effector binding domain-containing protein [Viridibacterium curvum]|uniref:C-di-GMP-binding multidrug transporter transcriptional regulator BrlR n=1 Tax=Viridibacterium curvum TaxID=1101404 RepID=A0ABP9QA28_9RHOO